jgi:hypothetical protein
LRLALVGQRCNRDAIGATVSVHLGDQILRREVNPTRSYLSQSELPVTFGLGSATRVDKIVVRWPGEDPRELDDLPVDRSHIVKQVQ